MGSRERKRAERRKRKRRTGQRSAAAPPADQTTAETDGSAETEGFQERMVRRSEQRNAEVRAGLEPLTEGERPRAVTAGAAVSALLALIFTASAGVAAIGSVEISGEEPSPLPLAVFAAVLWLMTWGMWKARYWAVLGMQALLALVIIAFSLFAMTAASVWALLLALGIVFAAGTLFWFMVKAMARIQMPTRDQ